MQTNFVTVDFSKLFFFFFVISIHHNYKIRKGEYVISFGLVETEREQM